MMATESKTAVANALVERLADAHARWDAPSHEGSSVYNLQREAFDKFIHQGIPTTRNEEWKYTPLDNFLKHDYTVANVSDFDVSSFDKLRINSIGVEDFKSHKLVFINGRFAKHLSEILDGEDGLDAVELQVALQREDRTIRDYFNKLADTADALVNLNTGFAQSGLVITVKRGAVLSCPIHVINITDRNAEQPLVFLRNLFVIEPNAQAVIFNSTHSVGMQASLVNAVEEIVVRENANVEYVHLQDLHHDTDGGQTSALINQTFVRCERDSRFNTYTLCVSGDLIRNNLTIRLNGQNAEAHLLGLYMPKGSELMDNHTLVDHAVPNCYSNELYKGLVGGKSRAVFNGKILVREDAQKTNAFQSNKNVLLSNEATVYTKPQLEIFADDVKCSHGATSGQMDDESLFYLQSRGISKQAASQMLMLAFADDVITKIKHTALRTHLSKAIAERLVSM